MNSKTKILIGVLVVGVILAGGWWIWNYYSPNDFPKQYTLSNITIYAYKSTMIGRYDIAIYGNGFTVYYGAGDCKKLGIPCGVRYGTLSQDKVREIVHLFKKNNFLHLKEHYEPVIRSTDLGADYVRLEINNVTKTVEDYGKSSPSSFREIVNGLAKIPKLLSPVTNSEKLEEVCNLICKERIKVFHIGKSHFSQCMEYCIEESNQTQLTEKVIITKEQAIAIANQTEEVQKFLKLYPDAKVNAMQHCCAEVKVYGGECRCIRKPDDNWIVAYCIDRGCWGYRYIPAVRVAINSNSGEIIAKYPKLEYLKNAIYCGADLDCLCLSGSGLPFVGCANFIHGPRLGYGSYECKDCRCVNNTCMAVEEKQQVSITTDKTEYEQGEIVRITIRNNLDNEKWLHRPFYTIERSDNGNWIEMRRVLCPCGALCKPIHHYILQPHGTIEFQWDQKETWCSDSKRISKTISKQVPFGKYRVKSEISDTNKYKSKKTIYSNEFTIKEKQEPIIPKDKESCEAQGGKWGNIGLSPEDVCNLPTSDAGKECSDSDECEGSCIAELSKRDWDKAVYGVVYTKGKCTAWKITVGCHAFVEDGKVEGILCVD